jgi:hypothetical protein
MGEKEAGDIVSRRLNSISRAPDNPFCSSFLNGKKRNHTFSLT